MALRSPAADFAAINQADFDRIEILKDAVATASYGSRGANGVIVINTRRGKAGQLQLNYDGQVGFSQIARRPVDRHEQQAKNRLRTAKG